MGEQDKYAMVAASVTSGLRCGDCHRLYAYLDRRQGGRAWAVKGAGEVAKGLSWQSRTAKKHLRHLADVGLIELDPEPAPAWGNTLVRVVHAPARRRYADPRSQPGVWEPEPDARWRKPAKTAAEIERLRANGWRSAPTVRPDHAATPEAVFERPRPLRRPYPCLGMRLGLAQGSAREGGRASTVLLRRSLRSLVSKRPSGR